MESNRITKFHYKITLTQQIKKTESPFHNLIKGVIRLHPYIAAVWQRLTKFVVFIVLVFYKHNSVYLPYYWVINYFQGISIIDILHCAYLPSVPIFAELFRFSLGFSAFRIYIKLFRFWSLSTQFVLKTIWNRQWNQEMWKCRGNNRSGMLT